MPMQRSPREGVQTAIYRAVSCSGMMGGQVLPSYNLN